MGLAAPAARDPRPAAASLPAGLARGRRRAAPRRPLEAARRRVRAPPGASGGCAAAGGAGARLFPSRKPGGAVGRRGLCGGLPLRPRRQGGSAALRLEQAWGACPSAGGGGLGLLRVTPAAPSPSLVPSALEAVEEDVEAAGFQSRILQ